MKEAEIEQVVKNLCNSAIAYGKRLKKPLDGSFQSVLNMEKMFDVFCKDLHGSPFKQLVRRLTKKELTMSHVEAMAKVLGTYLGELIRAKLGSECKWSATDEEGKETELHLVYGQQRIFPVQRACDRLLKGREASVLSFYNSFKRPE